MVIGAVIYTSIMLTNASTDSDSMINLKNQVYTISGINAVIIILLCGLSFMYVRADPLQERSYVLIMLHVNFFFSLLAVSISSLHQLN
jgi:hypothetical protein